MINVLITIIQFQSSIFTCILTVNYLSLSIKTISIIKIILIYFIYIKHCFIIDNCKIK